MISRTMQTGIAVSVAIAVLALFFIAGDPFSMFRGGSNNAQGDFASPGQLVVQDEIAGTGQAAGAGDLLTVHYTGRLSNGMVFDTSVGSTPYEFVLGAGEVIPGWDLGLAGMQEGGRRLLIIPPELAYGETGFGPIPPNATLIFEVSLIGVETPSQVE